MFRNRIKTGGMPAVLLACAAASPCAVAQTGTVASFPAKPIRIVVPSTPAGANDFLARLIGPKLTEAWGQQVLVDNRPGAGGIIGAEIVAKAPPDGYTLIVVATGFAVNPFLYTKLPYDTVKDFAPVTLLASTTHVLVLHPSLPVRTVKDLLALARAKPGQLTYASSGTGTGGYLCAELMKKMGKLDMIGVPYKGAGAATVAVLGGEVGMLFTQISPVIQHIRAKKLYPLATTTLKRAPELPEVPTLAESGLPGFEVDAWTGLLATGGTPADIVLKLQGQVAKALQSPEVRERLVSAGFEPVGDSPAKFAALIKSDMNKWSNLIREAGIKPEAAQ